MGKYQGIVISGFGGQGILSVGRIIAQAGMIDGLEVSWLPSYGPEMRGGTAYVHVILSDEKIGSPLLNSSTALIAMNTPSFEKYKGMVVDGGIVIVDGSLVEGQLTDDRREFYSIPATALADKYSSRFANIILIGKLIARTDAVKVESFEKALYKVLPQKYQKMIPEEMEMLKLGMEI
ncbi:MAG: 2-oxoacid:acceptor oxidoreductase family protein [Oscillospiraceae bacterium]|nr:2-oxoacid:acceptor oxidoreductase family protein [Oscillospiraceae bacterium]